MRRTATWRGCGCRCGRRRGWDVRNRTEMVSCSGHGGLGTERRDKIMTFYIRLRTRDQNPGWPVRFGRVLANGVPFVHMSRMLHFRSWQNGSSIRANVRDIGCLCDRKLGTQVPWSSNWINKGYAWSCHMLQSYPPSVQGTPQRNRWRC